MLRDEIVKFIKDYGYVTFPELTSKIPKTAGDQYIALPGYPNIWLWSGLSPDGADAIIELIEEQSIFVHPASQMTKLAYGGALNLPEATKAHQYAKPHWFVCVLHHSPIEESA